MNARTPVYEFGEFRLDTAQRRLLKRDGEPVPLSTKAYETLLHLVEHSGKLLSKDELLAAVWPDTAVEQNNLNQSISALRRALGERPEAPAYIATVSGHGYRFVAEVQRTATQAPLAVSRPDKTLAVLPFANLSTDPENEFFCDGLTEELMNALARVDGLKVVARSSAFAFKGKRVAVGGIGTALGVETILDGSVRRSGNRLRIIAQLVNATNGYNLWSNRYDREVEMRDIFDVQDEITLAVVEALKGRLLGNEKNRVLRRHTDSHEAYELYLRGRHFWFKFPSRDFEKSRDYYQRAITADPNYALAFAGLAEYYGFGAANGLLPPTADTWAQAAAAAATALTLDEGLLDARNALAGIKQFHGDRAGAERDLREALALSPDYAEGRHHYAHFLLEGERVDEALVQMQEAVKLDPLSVAYNRMLAIILYRARRYDLAVAHYRKTLELDPNDAFTHELLGSAFEQQGLKDEAVAEWARALKLTGSSEASAALQRTLVRSGFEAALSLLWRTRVEWLDERVAAGEYVPAMDYVLAYTRLGNKDQAVSWLRKAQSERNGLIYAVKTDPVYDVLRADQRCRAIIGRF